jgi:hypothetical protein
MPIVLITSKAQLVGIVASPLFTNFLAVLVPIVPITHLFNVVVMSNKEIMGMHKRVYARKSLNRLGTLIGTRRFLCARN